MGWGMPASMTELAPTVMDWWYRVATSNDTFAVPAGGLGYTYPSMYSPQGHQKHMIQLEHLMKKGDLEHLVITESFWPNELTYANYSQYAEPFAQIENMRGLFLIDVNGDYARYGRRADVGEAERIYWFNDKPLVPCRFTLWNSYNPDTGDPGQYEGLSRTPAQLAATLNSLPTDPCDPDSYSFVFVHAWSYTMPDIKDCIDALDPDVRVVTPQELIEQIYINFGTCANSTNLDSHCEIDIVDLTLFFEQWLKTGSQSADYDVNGVVDFEDYADLVSEWGD